MDALGLDPQQVLQRQRIAAFLQRKHHFGHPEVLDEPPKIMDRRTRDRFFDNALVVAHRDIGDDGKSGLGLVAKLAQTLRPVARAQHHHPAAKGRGTEKAGQQQAVGDQHEDGETHGVEEGRAPEEVARDDEVDHRQRDDAKADRHQHPRARKAQGSQGIRPVDPDRDHRQPDDHRGAGQRDPAVAETVEIHPDLSGAKLPCQLACQHQQAQIEQAEQQHGVRDIVLEQADHDGAGLGCMRGSSLAARP